jgi:hypothetical protein
VARALALATVVKPAEDLMPQACLKVQKPAEHVPADLLRARSDHVGPDEAGEQQGSYGVYASRDLGSLGKLVLAKVAGALLVAF